MTKNGNTEVIRYDKRFALQNWKSDYR